MTEFIPELTSLTSKSTPERGVWVPESMSAVPLTAVEQDNSAFNSTEYYQNHRGGHLIPHASYLDYFKNLDATRPVLNDRGWHNVETLLIASPEASKQDELLIIFGGFTDVALKTSPDRASDYARGLIPNISSGSNTWATVMRSGLTGRMLDAAGRPMPVMTIYEPDNPGDRHLQAIS